MGFNCMDTPNIQTESTENIDSPWIAGFWKRFFAFLIDSLLLAVIGFCISELMVQFLVENPGIARLIGFVIAFQFSIIFDSKICHGQTPGKKILKLRVVDKKNKEIGILKAALRSLVFSIPFFLNSAVYPEFITDYKIFSSLLSLVLFGGLFGLAYLIIFNRGTRQSLHDLVTGTYVVNSEVPIQPTKTIWIIHPIIVITFAVITLALPWTVEKTAKQFDIEDLMSIQNHFSTLPIVINSKIMKGESRSKSIKGGSSSISFISTHLSLREDNTNDEEFAKEIASYILLNSADSCSKDVIRVNLTYGYTMVISGRHSAHAFSFKPSELGCLPAVNNE